MPSQEAHVLSKRKKALSVPASFLPPERAELAGEPLTSSVRGERRWRGKGGRFAMLRITRDPRSFPVGPIRAASDGGFSFAKGCTALLRKTGRRHVLCLRPVSPIVHRSFWAAGSDFRGDLGPSQLYEMGGEMLTVAGNP